MSARARYITPAIDLFGMGPDCWGAYTARAENEDLYRLEELLENGGELPAELVER